MTIHEVLDYLNQQVGYKGLDNTGKTTADRDDIITRQGFHKMVKEYNQEMNRTNQPQKKIRKEKINQYKTKYYPKDIDLFLKYFDYRLNKQKKMKTVVDPALKAFGVKLVGDDSNSRISKRLLQERQDGQENSITDEEVDKIMMQILGNFIDLRKVKNDAIEIAVSNRTNLRKSIDYNDYLLK